MRRRAPPLALLLPVIHSLRCRNLCLSPLHFKVEVFLFFFFFFLAKAICSTSHFPLHWTEAGTGVCLVDLVEQELFLMKEENTQTFFCWLLLLLIVIVHYHSDAGLLQLLKNKFLISFQEKVQHVPCFLFKNENAVLVLKLWRSQQMECQWTGDAKQTFSVRESLQVFLIVCVCLWDVSFPEHFRTVSVALVPALAVGVATAGNQCSALWCTEDQKDEEDIFPTPETRFK